MSAAGARARRERERRRQARGARVGERDGAAGTALGGGRLARPPAAHHLAGDARARARGAARALRHRRRRRRAHAWCRIRRA